MMVEKWHHKLCRERNRFFNIISRNVLGTLTYWAFLSRLLYNKKIPAMPPLLVDGKFASDFCEKANLFNNFFSAICTPIQNTSIFPPFLYRINTRTTSFRVTKEDILLIIKALDSSKAHGWDNILKKLFRFVVSRSLFLLRKYLNNCWKNRNFQNYGKKQMQFLYITKRTKTL